MSDVRIAAERALRAFEQCGATIGDDLRVVMGELRQALYGPGEPLKSCTCQRCELCGNPAPDGYCTNCKRDVHKPGPIADPRGIVSTTNITLPPSENSN